MNQTAGHFKHISHLLYITFIHLQINLSVKEEIIEDLISHSSFVMENLFCLYLKKKLYLRSGLTGLVLVSLLIFYIHECSHLIKHRRTKKLSTQGSPTPALKDQGSPPLLQTLPRCNTAQLNVWTTKQNLMCWSKKTSQTEVGNPGPQRSGKV